MTRGSRSTWRRLEHKYGARWLRLSVCVNLVSTFNKTAWPHRATERISQSAANKTNQSQLQRRQQLWVCFHSWRLQNSAVCLKLGKHQCPVISDAASLSYLDQRLLWRWTQGHWAQHYSGQIWHKKPQKKQHIFKDVKQSARVVSSGRRAQNKT